MNQLAIEVAEHLIHLGGNIIISFDSRLISHFRRRRAIERIRLKASKHIPEIPQPSIKEKLKIVQVL